MRQVILKVGPLAAANPALIAASQTAGSAGALTLTGAPVVLDNARRVIITSAGNDSVRTFAITGTNWSGNPIGEILAGANAGVAQSVLDYATVTGVTVSGATASTVTVGTNGVASSPWFRMDDFGTSSLALQSTPFGTANGTVQYTMDDPNSLYNPVLPYGMTWVSASDPTLQGFTGPVQSSLSQNQSFIRVVLNSGTGYIVTTLVQGGSPPA